MFGSKVMLVSRVNFSTSFVYEGETIVLSPKQRTKREFVRDKLEKVNPQEILTVR